MKAVPRSRYVCFILLAAGGVASDLLSKSWVFAMLGGENSSSEWSWGTDFLWGRFEFRLSKVFNQGALFGIGQGLGWLFAALSVLAAAGIIYWLFVRGEARSWWLTVTLALILAGALGNLYDRLHLYGGQDANGKPQQGVRDFLHCTIPGFEFRGSYWPHLAREYQWPVFNLADVYLVTGAIMLTLYSLVTPGRKEASTGATQPLPAVGSTPSRARG